MKSGQAALFVDRMLQFEAQVGSPRYSTWSKFRFVFVAKFCKKNKMQMALAKLETPSYFQGYCIVNKYIDNFCNLIDHAGYTEGLAIVTKF